MSLQQSLDIAVNALREISKKEGQFSRDHLTHASNTIDDMAEKADQALTQIEALNKEKTT